MALIRWEPVPTRLFTSLFDTPTTGGPIARRAVPATDVAESDSHYVLRTDLPGVAEEDISVTLDRHVLTISGVRRSERGNATFRRSVRLPEGVEAGAIDANVDRGVLEVTVAKPATAAPQEIAVTVGPQPRAIEETADAPEADEAPESTEPVAA